MSLFIITKEGKLDEIQEEKIILEKELQTLVERNLEKIFGLDFISTEFQHDNLRIDTLAFDNENKSFVIIEYKRDKSFSIIDQGFAYLSTLLNNRAEYVLEYNESKKLTLSKNDIDWSQTKVLFIAQSFTTHQKTAIGFKDLPIELWEARKYQNNMIQFSAIRANKTTASIKSISSDSIISEVAKEIKNYAVEDFTQDLEPSMLSIFEELRERLLELDDRFEEVPTKTYIGYKIYNRVIISLSPKKTMVKIGLNRTGPSDIIDEEKKVRYIQDSYKHLHQHFSELNVLSLEEIEYALGIIRQVVKKQDKI